MGPAERLVEHVFVGRDKELNLLLQATTHPPSIAIVEGEAGVGKTTLVRELLARLEGGLFHTFIGRCHDVREPFPFGPLIEALRGAGETLRGAALSPVTGVLRPLLPELSGRLPPRPEPLDERAAERHRMLRGLRELLDVMGPTVLVLEDMHWMDESTIDFAEFLVGDFPTGLVLVVTYRAEDVARPRRMLEVLSRPSNPVDCSRLLLRRLSADDVRAQIGASLEVEEVSETFARFVYERTDGLPFAVQEILGLLQDRRDLIRREGRWVRRQFDRIEVPSSIRDFILARVERLPTVGRRTLWAAAVLGIPSPEELIRQVAGLSAEHSSRGLTACVERVLLLEQEQGHYAPSHELATQAIYEGIPGPERRQLHLRAARALKRSDNASPAQLAYHYRGAGRTRAWVKQAEAAAKVALGVGNEEAAAAYLCEALSAPDLPRTVRSRLSMALARACLDGLPPDEAVDVLREILAEDSLTLGRRGEVRLLLGLALDGVGQTEEGMAEIERSVAELARRPAPAVRAMINLALPISATPTAEDHLAWLRRAEQTAQRADSLARLRVTIDRPEILLLFGNPGWRTAIKELPEGGATVEERRQLTRGLANLADAAVDIGHYGSADEFLRMGDRFYLGIDESRHSPAARVARLMLEFATGRWNGLEAAAHEASEQRGIYSYYTTDARAVLGMLMLARGEVERAEDVLTTALRDAWASCSFLTAARVASGLARLHLSRGESEPALAMVREVWQLAAHKRLWLWGAEVMPMAAEALLATGRGSESRPLIRRFADGTRARDAPIATASLYICRGIVAEAEGRSKTAAEWYRRGERAWRGLPRPYDAHLALERRGRLLAANDPARGASLLAEALASFRRLGARWDASRVERSLRELGVRVPRPWRGGRRSYGDELSPRERDIGRLVALGLTNREIAERLFLSPKTVANHLTSAMRKLEVSSRTGLAVAVTSERGRDKDEK